MEHQLKYEEWFFQSDYDLETAYQMLQSKRNIYCVFMCHLSLEKALKGLFIKRLNEFPPKLHALMYFVNKIELVLSDEWLLFIEKIDGLSIVTRYPEDLRAMITLYTPDQTKNIYDQYSNG
ncbi:MAG: HEPN domain-containing protein [Prevotellaceae bacterium]|jgi:HEPN domain-containing protein|nr:HEPN domain-containing protein [Prevotellaceae bacterium]